MTLTTPYPVELLRVAQKVVWYDKPEQTLVDLPAFLTHLMVYGLLSRRGGGRTICPRRRISDGA
jgi:hypothetical protein